MSKKKYKEMYYTIRKNADGEYKWYIRNKEGEVLQISEETFSSKQEAEIDAEENIDEYYY